MDISKSLLEKHELGQCNDEELATVQAWLNAEDWGDLDLKKDVDETIKDGMWADISSAVATPSIVQTLISPPRISTIKRYWWTAAAACFIMIIGGYHCFYQPRKDFTVFQAANAEPSVISFSKDHFDVMLSPNSEANIDFESGNISLTGNIMLRPKRDFVLQDGRSNRSFNFKQGEVYFVSEREEEKKLIILSKREMIFLPPVMQRRIKQQFHIS
ncbi:hypothetical protein [Sphingobacterium faecale]|uniref:FecR protein domain-containing protein n=1 Tax=Sphingobacterium faecale TaxID=2803775 RepID=A0ABS1R7W6_9SPHI|nr:hypothetical protein [Sphingobacterium faecale]MBL1410763.1 hypothetical protein [Sphingobacterium faecale]